MPVGESAPSLADARPGRPAWVTRLLLVGVAAVATFFIVRLVGRIDWDEVGRSLGLLDWWHALVLLVLLLARQLLNSMPISFYLPGVTAVRAAMSDLAGSLLVLILPPPGDLAMRLKMLASWGVAPGRAIAGLALNMTTFYIVRFATPLAGFAVLVALSEPPGIRWLDLASVLVSAVLLGGLLVVVHSEQLALTVGTRSGRAVRRVRRSVDPDAWGQRLVTFREDVASRFRRGFPRGLLSQVGMIAVDLSMVVVALRIVGISATEVSGLEVAAAYLFAFPLTLLPFMGLGVVDALILAAVVGSGGLEVEAAAVAGLMVWRIFTIAGPALLGIAALAWWRRDVRQD